MPVKNTFALVDQLSAAYRGALAAGNTRLARQIISACADCGVLRMDAEEPESWITVNGVHIPLDKDGIPMGGQLKALGINLGEKGCFPLNKAEKTYINNIAKRHEEEWPRRNLGIRVQQQPFELGEVTHNSHVWENGEDTGEELPGICVIGVDSIGDVKTPYVGTHVALIGGDVAEYGEDVGEAVFKNAEVLEIIC